MIILSFRSPIPSLLQENEKVVTIIKVTIMKVADLFLITIRPRKALYNEVHGPVKIAFGESPPNRNKRGEMVSPSLTPYS